VKVAELLIARGAKINISSKPGFTPLNLAQKKGHKEMVKLLVSKGGK